MPDSTNRFHHPFQPYDIQVQLMHFVYDALDSNKKVCIVESPTGTGKTLSLICSTVTWLRENKAAILSGAKSNETGSKGGEDSSSSDSSDSDSDDPDWVKETYISAVLKEKLSLLRDYEKYLDEVERNGVTKGVTSLSNTRSIAQVKRPKTEKKGVDKGTIELSIEDKDMLPEPYSSESEGSDLSTTKFSNLPLQRDKEKIRLNKDIQELLNKIDTSHGNKPQNTDIFANASLNPVKVYFASRTYSQLNQFASQLALPRFPSSFNETDVPHERVKFVPLGSKKLLCIEPSVKRWKTLEAINDACSELRHSKEGCPFYTNTAKWHESAEVHQFRDNVYAKVRDVEDLVPLGESLGVCPYYSAKDSLLGAEIVTLPYQYLLLDSAREYLNLDLKNSIVVIDEAHNLIETINSIYSSEVSLSDLQTCQLGLTLYLRKFKQKLNPGNRVNLMKLLKLINVLIEYINENYKKPGQQIDANDIMLKSNADLLNIHKLNNYIKKSRVAFKIDTYISKKLGQRGQNPPTLNSSKVTTPVSSQPLLFKITSFLKTLTNPSSEGQFFFERDKTMKYMLLEPGKQFEPVLQTARCVVLAGGTMEPLADFYESLFPQVPTEKIESFTCNHIVPDENLKTFVINEPNFEFTFAKRQDTSLINDSLFQFILKLAKTVPKKGGIITFFPSYQYVEFVVQKWQTCGIFHKLESVRKVMYESKNGGDVLEDYIETVSAGEGAILFAVVGGKLSEGINFQDNLCRAVVMVGLPFPNLFSGELQIKKEHLVEKIIQRGGTSQEASVATREFYENICMKAVNQSVGRAIRHANDYALIYLLDRRYDTENIKNKLSSWVRNRIQTQTTVDRIMSETREFFEKKG